MTISTVVQLEDIRIQFGERRVLDGLHLHVEPGEVVSISGRSGSGKTTLLSLILGLIRPHAGTVTVSGTELSDVPRGELAQLRGTTMGTVFQHAELLPNLTAVENVTLPALLQKRDVAVAAARARELLDRLEVDSPDVLARDLSGGERQRTAVARALINEPQIVLADEPTGSLDTELRETALGLLIGTVRESDAALVIVTHDPSVAARADRHLRLAGGTLQPA